MLDTKAMKIKRSEYQKQINKQKHNKITSPIQIPISLKKVAKK